ncbi:hypothetical protein [Streptomyces sp. NPDC088923]|uniref:hypothetical protein n=1 Tax=Streptomyces sp. NPDC088923 TaxID=3365913 RepID=UPI003801912F
MRRTFRAVVLLVPCALVATACTASPTTADLVTGAASPSADCRVHQKAAPASRYTAGAGADPAAVLAMLRYWTANGEKRFCDGKGPTDADHAWAELYARLGGRTADAGGPASPRAH